MSAGFTTREERGPDGWREIAVNDNCGELVAVITRPMTGAKWFLHRSGRYWHQRERFTTKKAAIAALEEIAR